MDLKRAGSAAIAAPLMAVIFAIVRPLRDPYTGGLGGRLQWAAFGLVLWGLAAYLYDQARRTGNRLGQIAIPVAVVALTALSFIFPEDVDRIAETLFTVTVAVGLIGGLWILLNILLGQARTDWNRFVAIAAGVAAIIGFAVLRGNLSVTALVAEEDAALFGAGSGFLGHIEWPLFGAIVWGGGVYVLRRFSNRLIRVAIGVGLGVLSGWLIGANSLIWQRPGLAWGSIIAWTLIVGLLGAAWRLRASYDEPNQLMRAIPGLLTGAAIGSTIALWLRSEFVPTFDTGGTILAAALPLALIGARIAWNANPSPPQLAAFESRSQAVIFLGPALLFLLSALVIPAFITIFLSLLDRNHNRASFEGNTFDGFNAEGDAFIGIDNYRTLWNDPDSFDLSNWQNIFTSQLFWVALVLLVVGAGAGLISGTKQNGQASFSPTGSSIGSIALGGLLLSFAAFTVLRGTFFNNLWWVVTVTTMSVVLGLTIAVLSERAGRGESIAKSLIFMPMAISFVGASIVWRLQYQPRDVTKPQTGVLNAWWVQLGKLSHSGAPRIIVLLLLAGLLGYIFYIGGKRAVEGKTFGVHVGLVIAVGYLFIELIRRSLGGFQFGPNGEVVPDTIVFLQEPPFNNVFLMVILIWIQTGFSMVILSAAIKAVPTELVEAARVDGATESQSFFRVVLPQILPTVGVVATTLIVLVSKVFDIVKVSTGGNFGTNVLANDMFEVSFSFNNRTLGSAIAVFILVSVLPVMYLNIRRMQKARIS